MERRLPPKPPTSTVPAMRSRLALLLTVVAAISGCATTREVQPKDVPGRFVMTKGGFSEWLALELNTDGSYGLDRALFACVIGDDGVLPMYYGREEGTWKIDQGMVTLEPRARTKDFMDAPVFVAVHVQRLVFRREGGKRVLARAADPRAWRRRW